MNRTKVKLPYSDIEIEQLPDGQPVTDATAFLQDTIVKNTQQSVLNGLELGSGNGTVSFMLALQNPQWMLTGIELQSELADLAMENNARLSLNCNFIQGDLREHRKLLKHQGYELIYSNPPWVKANSGLVSPNPSRALSRQEISCTMKDVLACIEWCLAPNGIGWIIYPLERKIDLSKEIMQTELEVCNMHQSELSPHSFIAKLRKKAEARKW